MMIFFLFIVTLIKQGTTIIYEMKEVRTNNKDLLIFECKLVYAKIAIEISMLE